MQQSKRIWEDYKQVIQLQHTIALGVSMMNIHEYDLDILSEIMRLLLEICRIHSVYMFANNFLKNLQTWCQRSTIYGQTGTQRMTHPQFQIWICGSEDVVKHWL